MKDMLVRLHGLPDLAPELARSEAAGLIVRRAKGEDRAQVADWAGTHFGGWANEVDRTFERDPVSLFIATEGNELVGFAAYDATFLNFFGPTAVMPDRRGSGIGRVLLLAALHAQRAQGYAFSIIGGVGPAEFYAHVVGAELLKGEAALSLDW